MSSSDAFAPLFDEFPTVPDEAWEQKIRDDLGDRDPEEILMWDSGEEVSVAAYRRRSDLSAFDHVDPDASLPPLAAVEETPANKWRIRQNIAHPNTEVASRLAREAVSGGVTDIGLVAHPQQGSDWGLSLTDPHVVATILDDLPVNDIHLHLERHAAAPVLLGAVLEAVSSATSLRGTISYDPIAALLHGATGSAPDAFDRAAELTTTTPDGVRTCAVDGRVYHDAGATAVQELAYILGTLSEELAQLTKRDVSLPTICSQLHVTVSVSTLYFVEIAKLRALRLLVPQVIDAYATESDERIDLAPSDVMLQAETSRRSETLYDPYVNMLRASTEAMAATVGGCDVLSIRPFDAAARPADGFSSRIARNIQLILAHESHFDWVADPAAGSYYVEALTDRLAKQAWRQFQELEANGGLLDAIQRGSVQAALETARTARIQAVDNRKHVLVGTNHYPHLEETRLDDDVSADLSGCAYTSGEELPTKSLITAVRARIREGDALDDLVARLAGGTPEIRSLPQIRVSSGIEDVRLQTERYAKAHAGPPLVLLAPIGPPGPRSARATFARNFFGVAGFEIEAPLRFESPSDAAQAVIEMEPEIVVVCSGNDEYSTLVPTLQSQLNAHGPAPLLVVAAAPDSLDDDVPADAFVHRGMPLRQTLQKFQRRLGIVANESRKTE